MAKTGRPKLGQVSLTKEEIRMRHIAKLRENGGRIFTIRVRSSELVEKIKSYASEQEISETSAVLELVERSLKNYFVDPNISKTV